MWIQYGTKSLFNYRPEFELVGVDLYIAVLYITGPDLVAGEHKRCARKRNIKCAFKWTMISRLLARISFNMAS